MNETGSFSQRATRTFTRLLIVLVVFGLGAAVVMLLSQLNSRTFTTELADGRLLILKGRMMPFGAAPFRPSDPALADAYAPIPLEGLSPGPILEQRFTERDELDRALFDVLEQLARPRVTADDPQAMERGLYYIRRAERLSGLSEEQRRTLKGMQAEGAYYLARTRLDDARRQIIDALAQLKLSAESQSRHSRNASQMLLEIEPAAKALEDSLRRAVHTLSAPASPTEPPPAPPPAPNNAQPSGAPTQASPAPPAPTPGR